MSVKPICDSVLINLGSQECGGALGAPWVISGIVLSWRQSHFSKDGG